MPIYEYACESCGHIFDVLQKMGAGPLLDCPECDKPKLKKLLSAPNFRLKGQGWYETDFKKDNQRNLAGETSDKAKEDKKDKKSADKGSEKTKPAKSKPSSSDAKSD